MDKLLITDEMIETGDRIDAPRDFLDKAPRIRMSRRGIIKGLACGTIVPIVTGCSTNPVTGEQQLILPGFDNASLAAMSTTAWSEMKKQTPQTGDSRLRGRVLTTWDRTAKGRSAALKDKYNQDVAYVPNEWEVAVFDTDDVNAFVMPGQQVGVYRGITELTENDDQLASILGHEAGHIDGRHSAARASAQVTAQVAMVAGQVAIAQSEELRQYGNTLAALGGAAIQFGVLLPYSRNHELQADKLGVDYMHKAGYDVTQAPRLWELMDKKSAGNRPPEFMSTHPDPGRRRNELINYINANGYAFI
ncbi:MAG: M48 family metallopeptidase [Hyphomonas sp.]|jgi:predicted Zn-dependent protease|nr:M48 family metallopeptidase [Henriciella sp.]MBO6695539.1 M48 family metallopeptidase [Henriciella sp.]MCR9224227.1 M48 family metallopeptidase [Hyphomonas sp.]